MATTKFHVVSPRLWDRTFRGLTLEAKAVAFYVLTCQHRTSEGLFELSPHHVAVDTGLEVIEVIQAFEELHEADVMSYDPEQEVVLDRQALSTFPIRSPEDNRIKSAVRLFEMVPETPLRAEFLRLAEIHSPALFDAISEQVDFVPLPAEPPERDSPSDAPTKDLGRTLEGPPKDRVEKRRAETRREETSSRCVNDGDEGCDGSAEYEDNGTAWCSWCAPSAVQMAARMRGAS